VAVWVSRTFFTSATFGSSLFPLLVMVHILGYYPSSPIGQKGSVLLPPPSHPTPPLRQCVRPCALSVIFFFRRDTSLGYLSSIGLLGCQPMIIPGFILLNRLFFLHRYPGLPNSNKTRLEISCGAQLSWPPPGPPLWRISSDFIAGLWRCHSIEEFL